MQHTRIPKKQKPPRMGEIQLSSLVNTNDQPILNKGIRARLARVNVALVDLLSLADWLVTEEGDVTDVRFPNHNTQVFSEKESDWLMAVVLYHTATAREEHEILDLFAAGGDNPYTALVEGAPKITQLKPGFWHTPLPELGKRFKKAVAVFAE